MDLSDLETHLAPVSEEEPCGPDLEYDADFGEMERSAQSKSEQQFGDTVVEAEPPDWKTAKKLAESLSSRTRDMRVAVMLARATLNLDGLLGFQQSIAILKGYLENFWENVHPELDHDDNDDPTFRTNTLITLCDEEGMLRELGLAPLVSSRMVGQFSFRDVEQARETAESTGSSSSSGTDEWGNQTGDDSGGSSSSGPTLSVIEAAFSDVEIEAIQSTADATKLAQEQIGEIEQFVTEKVGVNFAVSLVPVRELLGEMNEFVVSQLERRGVFEKAEEEEEEASDSDWGSGWGSSESASEDAPAAPAAEPQGYRTSGKISSRKEAIKALDDVCDFYEENEPSSPLPLLIRRAQRLAAKSFLEILRDLAPDAVSQAEALGGSGSESGGTDSQESGEAEESSGW